MGIDLGKATFWEPFRGSHVHWHVTWAGFKKALPGRPPDVVAVHAQALDAEVRARHTAEAARDCLRLRQSFHTVKPRFGRAHDQ